MPLTKILSLSALLIAFGNFTQPSFAAGEEQQEENNNLPANPLMIQTPPPFNMPVIPDLREIHLRFAPVIHGGPAHLQPAPPQNAPELPPLLVINHNLLNAILAAPINADAHLRSRYRG